MQNPVGNLAINLSIMRKLHCKRAPALRHRTQVRSISEHLAQWHIGLHSLYTSRPRFKPLNLGPPGNLFNVEVTLSIPCPGYPDVSSLFIFYYDGANWLLAHDPSDPDTVQPGAELWMKRHSRKNHNNGNPSTIEIQVYHFSAAQAALFVPPPPGGGGGGNSGVGADDPTGFGGGGGGGGGCFISRLIQ